MKPSERRALREQKRAEKEAEAQGISGVDKSLHSELSDQSSSEYYRHRSSAEREARVVKKEGFLSKHSMLITALIVSCVVILGVAIGIDLLVKYTNENKYTVYDDGVDIDIASVYILHDSIYDVEWRHLEGFNYTDYSGEKNIIREYPIEGTDLVLWVGGPKNQKTPDFIRIRDYEPSEHIDISVDDPHCFFEERGFVDKEDD